MKQDWEMNSVAGFVRILLESSPRACEVLAKVYGIPFDSPDEVAILQALDQARKAHDQKLSLLGNHSEVRNVRLVHTERIILNSLRKWSAQVQGKLETTEGVDVKYGDVTRLLAHQRKRTAIESFIERNNTAASRFKNEPVLLLGEMARFVKEMLRNYLSEYWGAEPRFGNGAVFERIPMLARWEGLKGLTPDRVDLEWALAACKTEARLCAVPKQWDKDRLITVEPFESTFLQHKARLALGRTLCNNGFRRIVDPGISKFDGPEWHRRRALEASVFRGNMSTWGTLDLSDASDGITWDQVSWIMPVEVMATLDRGRSTEFLYKDSAGISKSERFHMYAGMGNATTFMVESIVFYALMRASVSLRGLPWKGGSVVGDDLLVNGLEQTEAVLWGLTALGYRVNMSKSYYGLTNPIRESCGCWAFNGFDVYVPAYEGYANQGTQLLALAEFIRGAPQLIEDTLHTRVGHWVNTPVKVKGTISVCDPLRAVTQDCIRWNRGTHQLEVKCLTADVSKWFAPSEYEFYPGGELAVLSRQVTTNPIPTASPGYNSRASTIVRAARQALRDSHPRVFITNSRGHTRICSIFTEEHEDMLDAMILRWKPQGWKIHSVSVPDPYSMKLTHRWVSLCAYEPEVYPLSRILRDPTRSFSDLSLAELNRFWEVTPWNLGG